MRPKGKKRIAVRKLRSRGDADRTRAENQTPFARVLARPFLRATPFILAVSAIVAAACGGHTATHEEEPVDLGECNGYIAAVEECALHLGSAQVAQQRAAIVRASLTGVMRDEKKRAEAQRSCVAGTAQVKASCR
jgi:hypothetical protein